MNGLEYIMAYCNVSQSFLAELLGVSRQSVYLWENRKKPFPEQRIKQLSEVFGLEERFFAEIGINEMRELCEKPVLRHRFNGKEYYSFSAHENTEGNRDVWLYLHLPKDRDDIWMTMLSPNDVLETTKRETNEMIGRIQDVIELPIKKPFRVHDRIGSAIRTNKAINALISTMEGIHNKPSIRKMLYWRTLWDTLTALCIAFDVAEEADLESDPENLIYGTSPSWIKSMAKLIEKHNEDLFALSDAQGK